METSILIARLGGPILVVAGLGALFNLKDMRDVAEAFIANRALVYIGGFLALLGGLAIVNAHNVWTAGWPVIITIFGWLAIAAGIVRMTFPALVKSMGAAMLAKEGVLRVAGAAPLVLGPFLLFVRYR